MYVSCSCLCCDISRYPTVRESLDKIKGLGFAAVDLDVLENWQHVTPSRLASDASFMEQVAETVCASGLTVSSFNCGPSTKLGDPSSEAFEQYMKEFAALLELSGRVDCPNITLQPGPVLKDHSPTDQLAAMRDHLVELAAMKGDRALTIGLEGHAHTIIEKPQDALAMIADLWPVVGYTYDPSHPELQGICLKETECLFGYTCHVHVRNASLGNMQDTMADGTVDFEWLVPTLKAHGYDGALSIEYFKDFDPDFVSTQALKSKLVALGVDARPAG